MYLRAVLFGMVFITVSFSGCLACEPLVRACVCACVRACVRVCQEGERD